MLLDLGGVTRTLKHLITQTVSSSPAWSSLQSFTVSLAPPDKLTGGASLSMYMYHLREESHFKNAPSPPGNAALRFTPMALELYYVLSSFSDAEGDTAALIEQLLMGLAAKGLRDYPIIDDETQIGGIPILDASIAHAKNRLRIVLQPMSPTEAVTYWTAGSQPLRLSSYYQVSVILMEPDVAPVRSGRVLSYGVQAFVGGAPHVDATQCTITYTPPGGTVPRSILAQPAQVAVGDTMSIVGSGFGAGSATLLVRGAAWLTSEEADPSWGLVASDAELSTRIGATAGAQSMLPGLYSAVVRVTSLVKLSNGSTEQLTRSSNAMPFVVVARVEKISSAAPPGVFDIAGTGFAPSGAVQVFVGPTTLVLGTFGSLNPGEFAVQSSTQLQVRLPSGLTSGMLVQVRLLVDDTESAPQWAQVP